MIIINFDNLMENKIGLMNGLNLSEIKEKIPLMEIIVQKYEKDYKMGNIPFLSLSDRKDQVEAFAAFGESIRSEFEDFIVIGIGGSALGFIALHEALNKPFYNLVEPRYRNDCPRVFVLDNIDPRTSQILSKIINPAKTLLCVISKSGEAVETLSNFFFFYDLIKRNAGLEKARENTIIITGEAGGPLLNISRQEKMRTFFIPSGVGGRFSVLSAVGLIPGAIAGIDIEALLDGAREMRDICLKVDFEENLSAQIALYHYLLDRNRGKKISVMMPYADRLYRFADWFRQLWAESLGKKMTLDGKVVYAGLTPVKALGATDQHSQLQLYLEGPNDKVITFLEVKDSGADLEVPSPPINDEDVNYLKGHRFAEILNIELAATRKSLTRDCRPNMTVTIDAICPQTLGELIILYEMATVYLGALYNINPFNQPAVEYGKKVTAGTLGYHKTREYKLAE